MDSRRRTWTWMPVATCGSGNNMRNGCTRSIASASATRRHFSSRLHTHVRLLASSSRMSSSLRRRKMKMRMMSEVTRLHQKAPATRLLRKAPHQTVVPTIAPRPVSHAHHLSQLRLWTARKMQRVMAQIQRMHRMRRRALAAVNLQRRQRLATPQQVSRPRRESHRRPQHKKTQRLLGWRVTMMARKRSAKICGRHVSSRRSQT
mmetsp:Transcript_70806/g.122611  ORF Transcript_70806/g.122611 Transcript_70806/m.122611 type:complete len:204 (-) Transcript_70806:704-1315(-)